jgi:hypothetical protein
MPLLDQIENRLRKKPLLTPEILSPLLYGNANPSCRHFAVAFSFLSIQHSLITTKPLWTDTTSLFQLFNHPSTISGVALVKLSAQRRMALT